MALRVKRIETGRWVRGVFRPYGSPVRKRRARAKKRANPERGAASVIPRLWTGAKVRRLPSGDVQVSLPPKLAAGGRRRNIAAGFYDEEGIFHPIRASFDYQASRAGEKSGGRRISRGVAKRKAKRRR